MLFERGDIVVVRHYFDSYIGVILNKHYLLNNYIADPKYEIIAYKCTKCTESIITVKKIPYISGDFLTLFDVNCLSINPKLYNALLAQSNLIKLQQS